MHKDTPEGAKARKKAATLVKKARAEKKAMGSSRGAKQKPLATREAAAAAGRRAKQVRYLERL